MVDNIDPVASLLLHRSLPVSESAGEATPGSSPRSLKKFALGLRQSRSLGRGAFAKEDWSFYARQRKQENPQVLKVYLEKAQNLKHIF
jgi:hypothetical protein